MSEAWSSQCRQRMDEAPGPRQKRRTVSELLHSRGRSESYTDDECRRCRKARMISLYKKNTFKIANQLRSRISASVSEPDRLANDIFSVNADNIKKSFRWRDQIVVSGYRFGSFLDWVFSRRSISVRHNWEARFNNNVMRFLCSTMFSTVTIVVSRLRVTCIGRHYQTWNASL